MNDPNHPVWALIRVVVVVGLYLLARLVGDDHEAMQILALVLGMIGYEGLQKATTRKVQGRNG